MVNAPYARILELLGEASIGVNTMVDEHFGINVVEFMVSQNRHCDDRENNDRWGFRGCDLGRWRDTRRARVRRTFTGHRCACR